MRSAETMIATAAADDAVYKKICCRIVALLIVRFIVAHCDRDNIALYWPFSAVPSRDS
jgi:hypothetical protein